MRAFWRSPMCRGLPIFWCTYACDPDKTTGAWSTHKISTHNPPHTQPPQPAPITLPSWSPPPLLLASSNKGGKYCTMCATPHQKRQAVLAALTADFAKPTAVVSAPAAVAKAITSAPTSKAVIGVPMEVVAAPAAAVSIAVATATVFDANFMLIIVCAPRHCCCRRNLCRQPLLLSLSLPPPQLPP